MENVTGQKVVRRSGLAVGASGFAFGMAVALCGTLFASEARAVPLDFLCITGNSAADCAIGEAQLGVNVTDAGGGLVSFAFSNSGPADSSITDVYFDDGVLGAITAINDGAGVDFEEGADPGNPPGGNPIGFSATFSADSEAPVQPNGVNPGESLAIIFSLADAADTFADVLADLESGALRIGLHVQGFLGGGSESFVNNPPEDGGGGGPPPSVPEPASLLLFASGLGAVAIWRRRRSR